MNLNNFEIDINPTILKRGLKYYNNGLVEELAEINPGIWQAKITGAYTYNIQVKLNQASVNYWHCNCPYSGSICKHVVASMLSIRDFQEQDSVEPQNNKPGLPGKSVQLKPLLEKSSKEKLINCVLQLIREDIRLLDKTLTYLEEEPQSKTNTKNFNALFNSIIKKYSSRGYIDYRSATGFTQETWDMITSLNNPVYSADFRAKACFDILTGLMKKVVNTIDDSDGGLGDIMMNLADVLQGAYPQLTPVQQQKCFKEMLYWDFESELADYGLAEYISHLAMEWATNAPELQKKYLSTLENVNLDQDNSYKIKRIKLTKLDALMQWGETQQAEEFALDKIETPEFRKIFVEKAINNKEFKKARSLLNEGIKLAKKRGHPGVLSDWREMLLDVAVKTNDIESIRSELVNILENAYFNINRYRQLKATYSADEWQARQANFAKQILCKNTDIYAQAQIFAEENQLRKLFDLIQANEFEAGSLFREYLKKLSIKFPEESANFYTFIIQHDLKQTGRKVYQQAVKDIKTLQKLPMGKAIASQLITQVMIQYKNRPSMLEIFESSFGKIIKAHKQ